MSDAKYTDRRNIFADGDADIDWEHLDSDFEEQQNQERLKATLRAVKKDLKE